MTVLPETTYAIPIDEQREIKSDSIRTTVAIYAIFFCLDELIVDKSHLKFNILLCQLGNVD